MTWEEFLAALLVLGIDMDCPPTLMISGPAGDNATRDLQQKGRELPNDEGLFSVKEINGSDFIWNGRLVRAHGMFSTGGHPALAGMDMVCCAGKIKKGYFFFHSGHYHPDLESALHFFADFVVNSCQGMGGEARDRKVARLCTIRLKLYVKGSEEKTYSTTFAEEAGYQTTSPIGSFSMGSTNSNSSPMMIGSGPMGMTASKPISMGNFSRPTPSQPKTITNSNASQSISTTTASSTTTTTVDSDSPGSLFAETGINTYGRHQLKVRVHGAPVWIDNSARSKCALCNATFGTFTWKHHCRRCGEIVCDKCSGHKKDVAHPAVNPKETQTEEQPVRVCDSCYSSRDLL